MKNREIITHINDLEAMAKREKKAIESNPGYKRMNIKVVHKIFANKRLLKEKIKPYEETLKELTDRFDVKMDAGGMNIKNLTEENREKFIRELNELLDIDVDIEVDKLYIEQFGDYDISQEDMAALEFMVI